MSQYKFYSWVVILFSLIGAYWLSKIYMGADLVDDSYIFFRYADNFADGYGFVFKPGERIEGYSSPLWVFILGVIAWLNLDVVAAARMLSATFGIVTFLILLGVV